MPRDRETVAQALSGTGIPARALAASELSESSPAVGPTDQNPFTSSFSTGHSASAAQPGVYLIGAGPGDPDLLTLKSLRILQSADIVLHDSLISPEILNLIPPKAHRTDVGKRAGFRLLTQQDINSLLRDAARKYKVVVRLKGGDPMLFGRAAEEIETLRANNIPFEIVPGISAAFASAAAAKLSLTDRRLASQVLFTTFSRAPESQFLPGIGLTAETTVVVYMPGKDYAEVSSWLQNASVVPETPVLVLSRASHPDQSQNVTTVAALAQLAALPAPALLIVGRVVSSLSDAASAVDIFHDSLQGASTDAHPS
jgi:uroporphyrin-III C-methyltransferase